MLWWTRINWVTGTTIAVGLFFVIYLAIKSFKYPDDKNNKVKEKPKTFYKRK